MSAKKRTTKASVTPRPHPITPAAEPKRISDKGPVSGPRPLTDLQATICDLAGDLIIRGGAAEDVDMLLLAVSRHASNRMFPTAVILPDDAEPTKRDVSGWRERLARSWPEADDATLEPADSIEKTLSEKMRTDIRGQLACHYNEFIWKAHWHELYLMRDVLNEFSGCSEGPTDDDAQCFLASAFMNQIGQGETTYVKVPREHINLIEEYVALLNRADDATA